MALKYVGDGTTIPGVPARDLTDKEEAEFGERIKEQEMHASRVLYEPVKGDAKSGKQGDKD